jgi:hypothetical protein
MPQPEDDPKSAAKKERYRPSTDRLMNQFLKMESGGLGRSKEYRRGHIFNFEWTQDQRDVVNQLMETGMSFEEAFDQVYAPPEK